ncbi:MAG TPA: D-arabinono-1,4-lactone oxidase [Armatimonadaceae bacterium]|nr:D-arabinono-1,4-lactone oxidase [Armatimonadaceae bacterium]
MAVELTNWAGNFVYGAERVHRPGSVEGVRAVVAGLASGGARGGGLARLKALGTRHSFNHVADSEGGDLISVDRLNRVLSLDRERGRVTIEGGVRYGELCRYLAAEGLAVANLASLPHISVAGAAATATHGSGDANPNLAAAVAGLEIVTASGAPVTLTREADGDALAGAVVGLGALGIVTKLTLEVVPAFTVRQDVYRNLPLETLEANFDAVTGGGYSVSLFTDWAAPRFTQVWRKRRVDSPEDAAAPAEPEWFGAALAARDLHPIEEISAENCTPQCGVPGPSHERLPHFRLEYTPSSGAELQTEYLIPRQHALPALRAVAALGETIAPLLWVSEVRTVAADDLWLSPCYRQACVAIHFTWKPDGPGVSALLPALDERLAPFDARPHWGKLFATPPERIAALYPRLSDFRALAARLDPGGTFRNAFLDDCVLG